MAINYVIELRHDNKGVAFNARDALKRSALPPSGFVSQTRFREEPSSERSAIIVTLSEDRNEAYLREILHRSHLIHPGAGFSIESIKREETPTTREGALQAKLTTLDGNYRQTRAELEQAKDENARLKRQLETAGRVNSPLEGLLGYFEQQQLDVSKVIDDDFDLRYLRKVLAGESENTFFHYVNFGRETPLSIEEVQELEQFDYPAALKELQDLERKVVEAREQLGYLHDLEEGKVSVPAAIKQSVIDSLRALEPEKVISSHEELGESIGRKRELHQAISEQKKRHTSLTEHMNFLEKCSKTLPVIFNCANGTVEIYFPFQSKKVKQAFVDDLTQELKSSYALSESDVELLEHRFLAYKISNASNLVERMVVAVPFPLRVAGFHKIERYQLGG